MERYSEVEIVSVTLVKMEEKQTSFVLWYNYYTDNGDFFSTKYKELTKEITLNEPITIRYVVDHKVYNWKRIMGVEQESDGSTSDQFDNGDIPF